MTMKGACKIAWFIGTPVDMLGHHGCDVHSCTEQVSSFPDATCFLEEFPALPGVSHASMLPTIVESPVLSSGVSEIPSLNLVLNA